LPIITADQQLNACDVKPVIIKPLRRTPYDSLVKPSILGKRRSVGAIGISDWSYENAQLTFDGCVSRIGCCDHQSPDSSPFKSLPFSPSQFLNISGSFMSTPGDQIDSPTVSSSVLHTPALKSSGVEDRVDHITPVAKRYTSLPPRTPTPFKKALAEMERKGGSVKLTHQTPMRLEDLREVIRDDMAKENSQPSVKKARKSLDGKWSAPGEVQMGYDLHDLPVSPMKTLVGDCGNMFSPPCIMKETLHESMFSLGHSTVHRTTGHVARRTKSLDATVSMIKLEETSSRATDIQLQLGWERVACGQTDAQVELIQLAHEFLQTTKPLQRRYLQL